MSIHEITDDEFAHEVLGSDLPVLVEFWAPWCGPCRQLAPVLEQLAEERAGTLKVVKINQDEHPRISAEYRVMGVPTMLVFDRGEAVIDLLADRSRGSPRSSTGCWRRRPGDACASTPADAACRNGAHGGRVAPYMALRHLRPQQAAMGSRPGGGVRGVGRRPGEHAAHHRRRSW
jgi:thioredoxin 1